MSTMIILITQDPYSAPNLYDSSVDVLHNRVRSSLFLGVRELKVVLSVKTGVLVAMFLGKLVKKCDSDLKFVNEGAND